MQPKWLSLVSASVLLAVAGVSQAAPKHPQSQTAKQQQAHSTSTNGKHHPPGDIPGPWMTGPLLAPAAHVVPAGHINFEPYLFITDTFGTYNNHWKVVSTNSNVTVSPTMVLSVGLIKRVDLQVVVPYDFNFSRGQSDNYFSDSSLTLGVQPTVQNGWLPNTRLTIEETFPVGKFQRLQASKNGTDTSGIGSYQTTLAVNMGWLTKFANSKYLRTRLSLAYNLPSSVKVAGINAFGGDAATNGTVTVGQKFTADLGLEYTLTQHWVPALDVVFSTMGGSTFRGATTVAVGGRSSDQVSLAPAIEYNFNASFGAIAGAWFTVVGRDTAEFSGAVMALNYYH